MRVIIALLFIGKAIANTTQVSDDTNVTARGDDYDVTSNDDSDNKSLRPVFPKRVQEFIITTKSPIVNNKPANRSKQPMLKIVQKAVKMKSKNYWKTATRRPALMKHIKFTVEPVTRFSNKHFKSARNRTNDEDIEREHDINEFREIMQGSNRDSSEESSETFTSKHKHKSEMKHVKTLVRRFHKLGSKISRNQNRDNSKLKENGVDIDNHTNTNKVKPKDDSSEDEDKSEFIFVKPKTTEMQTKKVSEDSDESGESTTAMTEKELKSQQKRSINVIEEENLGTTVAGFKFTGRVGSLSSDLAFRNIHT